MLRLSWQLRPMSSTNQETWASQLATKAQRVATTLVKGGLSAVGLIQTFSGLKSMDGGNMSKGMLHTTIGMFGPMLVAKELGVLPTGGGQQISSSAYEQQFYHQQYSSSKLRTRHRSVARVASPG